MSEHKVIAVVGSGKTIIITMSNYGKLTFHNVTSLYIADGALVIRCSDKDTPIVLASSQWIRID